MRRFYRSATRNSGNALSCGSVRNAWRRPGIALCAALGMAVCLTGCQWLSPKPEDNSFRDEFKNWGEKNRPGGSGKQLMGLSGEAQQIEKNLGY